MALELEHGGIRAINSIPRLVSVRWVVILATLLLVQSAALVGLLINLKGSRPTGAVTAGGTEASTGETATRSPTSSGQDTSVRTDVAQEAPSRAEDGAPVLPHHSRAVLQAPAGAPEASVAEQGAKGPLERTEGSESAGSEGAQESAQADGTEAAEQGVTPGGRSGVEADAESGAGSEAGPGSEAGAGARPVPAPAGAPITAGPAAAADMPAQAAGAASASAEDSSGSSELPKRTATAEDAGMVTEARAEAGPEGTAAVDAATVKEAEAEARVEQAAAEALTGKKKRKKKLKTKKKKKTWEEGRVSDGMTPPSTAPLALSGTGPLLFHEKPMRVPAVVNLTLVRPFRRQQVCYMGGIFNYFKDGKLFVRRQSKKRTFVHLYGMDKDLLPKDFVPFANLLCLGESDKRLHYFGHMYGEYLDPMRLQQETVNLLEIGLKYGESLRLWIEAFPKGKIYGLDAFYSDPTSRAGQLPERVKIFKGDQENVTVLRAVAQQIMGEVGRLDFIVDDGGHTMGQQIASFNFLFPLLKPGGLYFVEDLQTSYWGKKCHHYYHGEPYCYGGGPAGTKGTMIDLLKSLVDVLHADFMEDHEDIEALNSGSYSVSPVDRLVGSIQCWRNMCVVRRKYKGSYF